MGLFDVLGALARVASERGQRDYDSYAAIDVETGKPMAGDTRPLPPSSAGFGADVLRAAQGRVTSDVASKIRIPESEGLTLAGLNALMTAQLIPEKEAKLAQDVKTGKALENLRNRMPGTRGGGSGSDDKLKRIAMLEKMFSGVPGEIQNALDPEYFEERRLELEQLYKETGRKPKAGKALPAAAPESASDVAFIQDPNTKTILQIPKKNLQAAIDRGAKQVSGPK